MPDKQTTEDPWCVLCGQPHAWGTACSQERLDDLRKRVEQIQRYQASQGIYHTANTTFVNMAASAYVPGADHG